MKERGILFSGEMVRAILAGRKKQTRRVVLGAPYIHGAHKRTRSARYSPARGEIDIALHGGSGSSYPCRAPHGVPGERLWVRETWGRAAANPERIRYAAELDAAAPAHREYLEGKRWRPSIHMPRSASRITLLITELRIERVQEITEADAIAEGAAPDTSELAGYSPHVSGFAHLWQQLNGPRGYGWDRNPWVWVISFARVM